MTQAKDLISEDSLQATVVEIARTAGWIVWFTHDARRSEPGEHGHEDQDSGNRPRDYLVA